VALPTLPDPAAVVTLGWTPMPRPTSPPRSTPPAGCSPPTRSPPPLPATPRCLPGRAPWAPSTASGWKAPAATAPGWRAGCAPTPQVVVEVDRPDRAARRRQGKADALDAHAPRPSRAGRRGHHPQDRRRPGGDDPLPAAGPPLGRQGRTQAANQLGALLVTAPDGLRAQLRSLPLAELVATAARLRPDRAPATPTDAATFALGVGRRPLAAAHRGDHRA
jgi:hypothetical protein